MKLKNGGWFEEHLIGINFKEFEWGNRIRQQSLLIVEGCSDLYSKGATPQTQCKLSLSLSTKPLAAQNNLSNK
jgi:hypothetical protein